VADEVYIPDYVMHNFGTPEARAGRMSETASPLGNL
jgi:hypothetical protein